MIVIPMAGASSRFVRAGYAAPKWRLPLWGRPVFDWCVSSFRQQFDSEAILVIHRNAPGVAEFVQERLDALGVREGRLVALEAPSRGQADTVAAGLSALDVAPDEPLTIFNIDTIRAEYRAPALLRSCDGLVECFRGAGDHWSFVRPASGPKQRALEVTEKVRVSDLCSDGLYWFRSARLFREMFALEEADPTASELYIAPLYQRMIESGLDVRYSLIPTADLVFSGTPDEYEAATSRAPLSSRLTAPSV